MSHISNMFHADANPCVESSALVYKVELAVKNTVGASSSLFVHTSIFGILSAYVKIIDIFRNQKINCKAVFCRFDCIWFELNA